MYLVLHTNIHAHIHGFATKRLLFRLKMFAAIGLVLYYINSTVGEKLHQYS